MEIPAEVRALIDKARAMQAKADACDLRDGHEYAVTGFSAIAHPEVMFPPYRPNVASVTEGITFSSYYCTNCGIRATPEEGRLYMAKKRQRGQ